MEKTVSNVIQGHAFASNDQSKEQNESSELENHASDLKKMKSEISDSNADDTKIIFNVYGANFTMKM